ncbi:DNA-binding transcriptional LysR family regulator [Pantoea sp. AN62]|uniref:LysR family transcriptional regulator n=1 Tax=Pantoea TaxID=53335 RepID=UPI00182A68DB|nr:MULTISPECIES: LysR family transcriptional regulator [Pantoea]MDU4128511.1 LysR family transcriptional regulator [Pantoea sp.]MDU4747247.1 LysR family transcriptional regulator [Pantoea sp.]
MDDLSIFISVFKENGFRMVAKQLGLSPSTVSEKITALEQSPGVLKLNVTGAVMTDILPPIMNPFLLRYPLLRVEIMVDDRLVDATSAGCDAGIRYGEQLAKDNIAVPIAPRPQTLALAAAPSYLALQDLPSHSADLAEHDCIQLKYSSGALIPLQFGWQGKIVSVNPAGRLIIGVNGAAAAIEFARQGRGIIATFEN